MQEAYKYRKLSEEQQTLKQPQKNKLITNQNQDALIQNQQQMVTLDYQRQEECQKQQRRCNELKDCQIKHIDSNQSPQINHKKTSMEQFLRVGGKGSSAEVEIVVDFQKKQLQAKKVFKQERQRFLLFYNIFQKQQKSDYRTEKKIYETLNKDFLAEEQQLFQLAILPSNCDDIQKVIYFQPGFCSLKQLLHENNFELTADQAVYVFTTLLEFILLMKEKGYCHCDIKPANTQFVKCEDSENAFTLKLIDFGGVTINKLKYKVYTPAFFNNPQRKYSQDGRVVFRKLNQRFKNEFYCVIRTMQYILLDQEHKNLFCLVKNCSNKQEKLIQLNQLYQIQEQIKQQFNQIDQNHLLHYILNFISSQGLEEKYSFQELQELLQHLKHNMTEKQKYFYDTQNVINKIVSEQLIKNKQRADPLSLLFGLNSFINQRGSSTEFFQDSFDLVNRLKEKLLQSNEDTQNVIIIGESGAGKTLLFIKLMHELSQPNCNCDIALVNLREISSLSQDQDQMKLNLCDKIQQQITSNEYHNNEHENLIVLLDGYDELNNKNLKISELINTQFLNYSIIRIAVTTRPRYATDLEINEDFSKPDKIYICPFNKDQIKNYIEKFLQSFKEYKEYMPQVETLEKAQDYLEIIGETYSLDQLCSLPFTLSLVIFMVPVLKKKMNIKIEQPRSQYTKYKLYEIFVEDYYKKRIENLCKDDTYQAYCILKYQREDYFKELYQDTKIFNQKCSWQMLKNLNLELRNEDLQAIFNEISSIYDKNLYVIEDVLYQISPTTASNSKAFSYLHKSFYEFYIAQSILEQTQNARYQALEEEKTMINTAFLRFDLDILNFISEHIMEMPLQIQYSIFFETWYRSVLLTRRIKNENITDESKISKLEIIGSNCINLLAALPRCDLTERDFSDCAIPNAYFYKRDLSGCNIFSLQIMQMLKGICKI